MEKILNKEELINEIVKMKRGTVYMFNILNDASDTIWCTMITKTRWFDSHVVIIGGEDNLLAVSNNFGSNDEDINDIVEKLINDYIEELFGNKYNQFTLTDKAYINIQTNSPALRYGVYDNFEYVKKK